MTAVDEEWMHLLQEVARGLRDHLQEVCAEFGLPLIIVAVLRQIDHEPGVTVSELARRSGIVKSHVSRTIEDLVQRGYVEKRPDPADQRLQRLHLTPAARDLLGRMRQAMRRRLAPVVEAVPAEAAAGLVRGLQALRAAMARVKASD